MFPLQKVESWEEMKAAQDRLKLVFEGSVCEERLKKAVQAVSEGFLVSQRLKIFSKVSELNARFAILRSRFSLIVRS